MRRCKFVRPETTRLTLPDGDWIDVKNTLSVGELRLLARLTIGEGPNGEKRTRLPMGFAQTVIQLVDWNLCDHEEKTIPIKAVVTHADADALVTVLDGMDQDDYRQIEQAIDAHAQEQLVAAAKKKTTDSGSRTNSST